jgi:hypothetical protein
MSPAPVGWYPMPAIAHWPRPVLRLMAVALLAGLAAGIHYCLSPAPVASAGCPPDGGATGVGLDFTQEDPR